jgi:hypothetical protein
VALVRAGVLDCLVPALRKQTYQCDEVR